MRLGSKPKNPAQNELGAGLEVGKPRDATYALAKYEISLRSWETRTGRQARVRRSSVPDLLSIEQVKNFFILRDRFLRRQLEALRGEFIAVPELIMIERSQHTQELGLPLLAFVGKVHVITT